MTRAQFYASACALGRALNYRFLPLYVAAAGVTQMPIAYEGRTGILWTWALYLTFMGYAYFWNGRMRDEQLTSVGRRRLLSAVQAGTSVALAMMALEYASELIDGRRALPWKAIPKGALEVVSALPSPRTGLDLYISLRLAAWAVISTALWFLLVRFNTHLAEAQRQERLRLEAEDTALRGRMAPAVIFNALETIKTQVERDPREAAATTDRLASLFRQVVEFTDRPLVTVREEVAFIETYLGIERARLGDRLCVKLEIAESVEERLIPPLSLQALVEDGVRHGVEARKEGGELRIWARWEGSRSYGHLEVGVEGPLPMGGKLPGPGAAAGLATLRSRLFRPEDLSIGNRGDRRLARFIWQEAEA
jgi:hypothetical protein